MKNRALYYRRKGKYTIIEGKEKGKSVLIWTLPDPLELLLLVLGKKASIIDAEKTLKINQKIERLDYQSKRKKKPASKVLTNRIIRTEDNAGKTDAIQRSQITAEDLWELTK